MNKEAKYIIKKEDGVVICKLNECAYDALKKISKVPVISNMECVPEDFLMNDVYTGVAKCHGDDEFDRQKGMELAYRIAVKKYHQALVRKINYIMNDYNRYATSQINSMKETAIKAEKIFKKAEDKLEEVKKGL